MGARARYVQAMEKLYIACIAISGAALVAITLIIPFGVFMRYVMNRPQSWPEPTAVVLMVVFSFLGGAAVYRANMHIAVEALLNAVKPAVRRVMQGLVHVCMAATALFMLGYGVHLCVITRHQTLAEFPFMSVAFAYAPLPAFGLLMLLFLLERVWAGPPPPTSVVYHDHATELE